MTNSRGEVGERGVAAGMLNKGEEGGDKYLLKAKVTCILIECTRKH